MVRQTLVAFALGAAVLGACGGQQSGTTTTTSGTQTETNKCAENQSSCVRDDDCCSTRCVAGVCQRNRNGP
jgi:hypothetical protein